jgi:alkylation response protein AidB-like acyl-CoA dehydrogenase
VLGDGELTALRLEVREFLVETLGRDRRVPCDCWQRESSREFSEALGSRGWLGMTLPSQYGGAGRSALERFVVAEELLAAGAPVAAHWITERQVAPSILRLGTEEQRRRFLPGIVRGEIVFAIGMSEPDSGSDLASVKSRARPRGDGWSLNGQKAWTSLAHEADYLLVLCRTRDDGGRHEGLSQLIVDTSLPGVEIRRIATSGGDDHFCEVFFDDVPVPADGLLGVEGEGWRQVEGELAFERGGPERYLSAWPLFEAFVRGPAGGDELATQAAGDLAARLFAVRQLAADIAVAMDGGEDFRVAAAMEKDAGTIFEQDMVETVARIAAEAALVDGEFAHALADATAAAPSFTLRGGTTEILRTIVARELTPAVRS